MSTAFQECFKCLHVLLHPQQKKNLAQSACDTNEAVNFLGKDTINRQLPSNLPAINARMIQIPFTVEYVIKQRKTKH
jgi:hypothetical protein